MSFNKWKDEYGLEFEPNYSKETELDCKAAFKAGQQSKQAEIDNLQKRIDDALEKCYTGIRKQGHILWFPTDNLNHIGISLAISKRYNILNRCFSQNRESKSYRKVHTTVDKSICIW